MVGPLRVLWTSVLATLRLAPPGGPASAQGLLAGRLAFYINGGYQAGSTMVGDLITVRNQLVTGASYRQLSTSTLASFRGTVPHPLVSSDRAVPSMDLASSYRERRRTYMWPRSFQSRRWVGFNRGAVYVLGSERVRAATR